MRKKDEKERGPDMHRPIDRQEIQQPNEGDPEARERGNLVGQTAEAQPGVFEFGAPSAIRRDGPRGGMSSSPDLTDPATAQFTNVTDDLEERTTREYLPPPTRPNPEEALTRRSDDDITVVAQPNMALGTEGAALKHSKQKMKEPKEPYDR